MQANFYCLMLFIIVVHREPPSEITLEVKKRFSLDENCKPSEVIANCTKLSPCFTRQ